MTDPSTPEPTPVGVEAALNMIANAANGPTFDDYRWSQLETRLDKHQRSLTNLTERLTALEEAFEQLQPQPAAKDRDDLNERIVAFLESVPTLKFSAVSIQENLGNGTKPVYDRCKTLVNQGRIRMHVEPNRRALYQAVPQPDQS